MSEDLPFTMDPPVEKDLVQPSPLKKGQRPKKRPSDFEITRTILQRTHERKLPILLRNMGEDSDLLFLCSEEEDGWKYGSSDMTIGLVEFDDPELSTTITSVLSKLYGFCSDNQLVINIRDQISELAKNKGESIDVEVSKNDHGSVWCVKTDLRGQERTQYYAKAIDSLYHFQLIKTWNDLYRPLLHTDSPDHLYYPYKHPDGPTYSQLNLPVGTDPNHPICKLYPNGFRSIVTRGIDVLITKMFEPHFPYPAVSEDLIVFIADGVVCQMAHRIIGQGWRMIVLRPNAYLFPTINTPLPFAGNHVL